ncbi:MAG: hypothetical protein QOI96_1051 [Verrucomicrobiota bacterium]|jgi:outer membrane biosynthesis protein TonB
MTTSEFIIGHSEDDAAERRDEPRKILFALLAALLLHLIVGYSIAVSGGLFSSQPVAEEDKPMELTMVDLSTPAPATKKNTMFMDTPDSKKVAEPPKEQTFESNANSRAASEQPATGDLPLPSQQGKDRPSIDLETHQASLAQQGAPPRPSVAPQETPQPSATPTPQPTATPPEQFAMLRATPTPSPETRPSSTPQQQASSYQPFKEQTRQSGRITNRGIASVNAVGTPLGRYKKLLYDSVGSRWYRYISQRGDMAGIGTAHVVFSIDRSGHVQNLKMIENTSNETFANICLQSIMEIELPPIPEELASSLPPEGLVDEISFTMFAN